MTATTYLNDVSFCLSSCEATWANQQSLPLNDALMRWVETLARTKPNHHVHLIGNGGSAAIVAHAQNDLVKAAGLRASVCQDVPLLTASANDLGYAASFSAALSIFIRPLDVLIAVSSSGESPNILAAVHLAQERNATVLTCSGFKATNTLRQLGDVNIYVPSMHYGYVELSHAAVLHYVTDMVAAHA